jgi:hypothetical protein
MVEELTARMSTEEFVAWRAFDHFNPIDGQRETRQLALLATMLANIHRDPAKHPQGYGLDDFDLYRVPQRDRPLTRAEEEARFRAEFERRGLIIRRDSA